MKGFEMYSKYNKICVGLTVFFFLVQVEATSQQSKTINLKLNDTTDITCKLIVHGTFSMGSPTNDLLAGTAERPQRQVEIKSDFYLGLTPVTVTQFRIFTDETGYKTTAETDGIGGHGYNVDRNTFEGLSPRYTWTHPGWIQLPSEPVVNVSMLDAEQFCKWLSSKTGKTVRLPAEEEWEYACRAGTTTIFFTGDSANSLIGYANVEDDALRQKLNANTTLDPKRTFPVSDGYAFTSPVGTFKPNPWGLYDMNGNVWQLCSGVFSVTDPGRIYNNVARGGAYNTGPEFLRCAMRGSVKASSKYSYIGFRVAVAE